jgi:chaperonin GroES
MDIRPLHDRLVIRRLAEGEQTAGRIIIPDSAREKPQRGTVIAVGNGALNDEGDRIAMSVHSGDEVLFGKYTGQEITLDGEELLIMRESDVLAIVGAADATTSAV